MEFVQSHHGHLRRHDYLGVESLVRDVVDPWEAVQARSEPVEGGLQVREDGCPFHSRSAHILIPAPLLEIHAVSTHKSPRITLPYLDVVIGALLELMGRTVLI